MSHAKLRCRTLGLSLFIVLGPMVFMATGAQANWFVLHQGKTVEPDVTLSASSVSELNLLVAAQKLEILCKTIETDPEAPVLLLEKSSISHGHFNLKSCKTWQSGKESPGCKPIEPILTGGLARLILHNGKTYGLLEPLTGKAFTIIKFNEAKCALSPENEVTGSVVDECGHLNPPGTWVGLDCALDAVTQLGRQAPAALFPTDSLKFGENTALVDGITALKISGPALYLGDAWGGQI